MIVALTLWACGLSGPADAPPEAATPEVSVEVTPGEAPPEAPTAGPTPQAAVDLGFVTLSVDDGPLPEQLAAQAAKAQEAGLAPFMELYGGWCQSCRDLDASLSDPRMVDAFAGTYVVRVDTVAFKDAVALLPLGGELFSLPSFYVLQPDGGLGDSIDGHAWGVNTPENMAPPLRTFFRAHGAVAPEGADR